MRYLSHQIVPGRCGELTPALFMPTLELVQFCTCYLIIGRQ